MAEWKAEEQLPRNFQPSDDPCPGEGPDVNEALCRGIELFNRREYFDCHDLLEDTWRGLHGPDYHFFQGLIQIAVALYHLENDNFKGASSQFGKGTSRLQHFQPGYRCVDIAGLLRDVAPLHRYAVAARDNNGLLIRPDINVQIKRTFSLGF